MIQAPPYFKLYGFPDPCQDPLVKNILEVGARVSAKPVVKKEPITPEMISSIFSSLRMAALFITAYCAFLRFDELAKGAFVWDQSGVRIIGIIQVSVCLGAILIPEYLDFHSGYSTPRSRIAGIYSGIHSYSGVFPNERALSCAVLM